MPTPLSPVAQRFIADLGGITQSFGKGRVVGQLYAYLYFSDGPRSLGDMQDALAISKGSASMSVRQLEQWEAVRKVWVKGDRKDYYEALTWFDKIAKNIAVETVTQKMGVYTALLEDAESAVASDPPDKQDGFERDRVEHLRDFHRYITGIWHNPLLQKLLK